MSEEGLDLDWADNDDKFALRVEGEGMLPDHIADGDYVIIDKGTKPSEGKIVVVRDGDGSAKLGRMVLPDPESFESRFGYIFIHPSAAGSKPTRHDRKDVVGVLVGVVRKC